MNIISHIGWAAVFLASQQTKASLKLSCVMGVITTNQGFNNCWQRTYECTLEQPKCSTRFVLISSELFFFQELDTMWNKDEFQFVSAVETSLFQGQSASKDGWFGSPNIALKFIHTHPHPSLRRMAPTCPIDRFADWHNDLFFLGKSYLLAVTDIVNGGIPWTRSVSSPLYHTRSKY